MSSFTTKLIIIPLADGKHWKLYKSFRYRVGNINSTDIIIVPKDFITDFASVPKIFWSVLPPYGKYGKAAVIHDYLYYKGKRKRKECDDIFYEGMKVLGVSWWKRFVMYKAVRWFGQAAWNSHRKKIKN